MTIQEQMEEEVRRIGREKGWPDDAIKILTWIGREAMIRGGKPIEDAELHRELLRLGKFLSEYEQKRSAQ